ncbi:MAG: CHAT domain-containing protein, partial [Methylococcaceae bacterium]|nr:CHAT domain-containing protein [Methylococcaceae bacterium]
LITLSACETALDESMENEKEIPDGREVEGLGTLMQQKGAFAVLATLWEVDDCGTELFMKQFYKQREKQKLTKAEAIRQTQLGFIKGDLTAQDCIKRDTVNPLSEGTPKLSHESEFLHPYYWAPFILMGNFL